MKSEGYWKKEIFENKKKAEFYPHAQPTAAKQHDRIQGGVTEEKGKRNIVGFWNVAGLLNKDRQFWKHIEL